ncbi:MAG: hypothetical protein ACI8U3_002831 [Brevundimonas sp.]|jgi:hypothetical protein|uniref:hypothetical protein n=1 Tax=Brevundimonas sp. TaxID=1871086 RepID=UPI0039E3D691
MLNFGLAMSVLAALVTPDQLRPLSEEEIARRFSNVAVIPEAVVHDRAERFFAGGRYVVLGRPRVEGRFEVRGGRLCTALPLQDELCREILQDEDASLYFRGSAGGRPGGFRLVPAEPQP